MQNKGTLRLFTFLLALVSVYQLYFTFKAKSVESSAVEYGNGNVAKQQYYLDSIADKPVMSFLGVKDFTYSEVKEQELNLGLDLKGGINVILQVSVKDILVGLTNETRNPVFNAALAEASKMQADSQDDYLTLFFDAFEKENAKQGKKVKLSASDIFGNRELSGKVNFDMTDAEVESVIRKEADGAIDRAFTVLRARIDKFGVAQPNIQRLENSGRILVELPGVKDAERVKKLLQSTAELEFWETYTNDQVSGFLQAANARLRTLVEAPAKKVDTAKEDAIKKAVSSQVDSLLADSKPKEDLQEDVSATNNPLFSKLDPRTYQGASVIGYASVRDTAAINMYLAKREVRELLPMNMQYVKFLWEAKPDPRNGNRLSLYALKSNRDDAPPLGGDVITDANSDFDQTSNMPVVSMEMSKAGASAWYKLTGENVDRSIAIVLDGYVYSAPRVNEAISGGRSQISGRFTVTESQDLANVLKAGKLPAPARIIQAEIVGPSLGQEAIDSGVLSFGIALLIVLAWMFFYYGQAGLFSDIALAANLLFIFGVLASLGAVLTLPGIAGIVLTIGMSVDANVLIYERVREELRKGKGTKLAIKDGYNQAYSSILDANVTTLLTGIILFTFGTGPVQGFATTLIIGILTSLFSAIFITRLLIERKLVNSKEITFSTGGTDKWFANPNFDFLGKRKMAYMISGGIILLGIVSLMTKGLNQGVDFVGGRTFTVRFENTVNTQDISKSLSTVFIDESGNKMIPEVKTLGASNQVKITTKYKIDSDLTEVDNEVNHLLFDGLKSHLPQGYSFKKFVSGTDHNVGIMQSVKVGPTIADDIKQSAFWAIFFSLVVVFLYILLRFRKVGFSAGAVVAVFHDSMIVLSLFSIFYGILPFSLEIDQAFIAAILTVIGYSLNDTVVVFDRIREVTNDNKDNKDFKAMLNNAVNSTLSRTINTSLTTFLVILSIFIFSETIRGFMFALLVGIVVGTYSSLFIATPVMYDIEKKNQDKK
ncbi:MAG: protein translocase subunit SecDF [Ichthyobacteriaceae bacterium]|nr:protein translocase subunit SecDF [Ichthyobacteriaceae bacterium]